MQTTYDPTFNVRGNDIVNLLKTNNKALGRALIVLRNRQTSDEQAVRKSRYTNSRGFRKQDAKKGTEHANFFEENGYLTQEMIDHWREWTKEGCRICVYWRQILREAYKKHVEKKGA